MSLQYRSFAKSSFINLSAQITSKFLSFLYMVFISRIIPPAEIGLFYLGLGVVSVFSVFGDLGMSSSLVRYVPFLSGRKEYEKLKLAIKTTFKFGLSVSLILSIVVFLFSNSIANLINRPEISILLKILSVSIFVTRLGQISANLLLTRKKVLIFSSYQVINTLIKIIAVFGLIYLFGPTAITLSWGYLLAFFLVVVFLLYFVLKEYNQISKESKLEQQHKLKPNEKNIFLKEYVSFGLMSTGIIAVSVFLGSTDKIMLSLLGVSNAEIGIYSLVFNLVASLGIVPSAITTILYPSVSEMFGKDKIGEMRSIITFSSKIIFILLIPLLAVLLLLPSAFISLIYGASYSSGWVVMVILIFGILFRYISSPAGNGLAAMKRLDIDFKILIVAVIGNILMDALFIPYYGIAGAAIGTAVSNILIFASVLFYSNKLYKFKLPKHMLKMAIAGLLAFVIMYPFTPWLYSNLTSLSDLAYLGSSSNPIFIILRKTLQLSIYAIIGGINIIIFGGFLTLFKIFGKEEYDILSSLLIKMRLSTNLRHFIIKIFRYGVDKQDTIN